MIKTKRIVLEIEVDLEIDTDQLDYSILGGEQSDFTEEEMVEEATAYFVQEIDYNFSSSTPAVKVLGTMIKSYG